MTQQQNSPKASTQATTMTAPTIGGTIGTGKEAVAWTGGQPDANWTGLENSNAVKASAHCFRSNSADHQQKAEARQVQVDSNFELFDFDCKVDRAIYAAQVNSHLKLHGLDSIMYIQDPSDNTTTISVVHKYTGLTNKQVKDGIKLFKPKWDEYDTTNDQTARRYLMKTIGPKLVHDIIARDPLQNLSAAEVWMHIMAAGSSVSLDEVEKIRDQLKDLKILGFQGHNVSAFTRKARTLWNKLRDANDYPQVITKHVLRNVKQVEQPMYRILIENLERRVETEIEKCRYESPLDQAAHMEKMDLDFSTILNYLED